ncbi:hypothetical protein RR48_07880 [Papilio machaon]|uniref:DUF4794 domain-containing protein n=1 Tax=Papilio machaon TaxID=76193 RepID=A0A194QV16_PAPMA|nr:hypothetical protein RR48_07880 [Papilio machaon]
MVKASFLFGLVVLAVVCPGQTAPRRRSRAAALPTEGTSEAPIRESKLEEKYKEDITTSAPEPTHRRNKALNLFGYFPPYMSSGLDYADDDDDDVTFAVNDENFSGEDLSRTIPSTRRQQNKKKNGNGNLYQNDNLNSLQYDNSPIFYIRLPPTPYMFVPGLGYVSQPPSLGPPMSPLMSQGVPQVADPFINLPLDFVSNGKPTGVYQWSGAGYPQVPQMGAVDPFGYGAPQPIIPAPRPTYNPPTYPKPKPTPSNSKITNLKGPYVFNGKPGDNVYVLRDTYNSIYSDALQNFYP